LKETSITTIIFISLTTFISRKYIIGRSSKVDIVIEEPTANRKHAQITVLAGGSASIQDLDSGLS